MDGYCPASKSLSFRECVYSKLAACSPGSRPRSQNFPTQADCPACAIFFTLLGLILQPGPYVIAIADHLFDFKGICIALTQGGLACLGDQPISKKRDFDGP